MATNNNQEYAAENNGSPNQGVAASLGLNTQLFAFQLINFALVAAIVWWLILKPLARKLEERKKLVDESVDNARAIETNLQMSEKKYQEKIDEAKVRANLVMVKAHEEADTVARQLKEKAHNDIKLLVEQAKKNLEIDKQEMKEEIKKDAARLVILAAEKLLNKELDEKENEKFINNLLKGI